MMAVRQAGHAQKGCAMVPETTHRVEQFGHRGGSVESRASSMLGMLRPGIVHDYPVPLDDDFAPASLSTEIGQPAGTQRREVVLILSHECGHCTHAVV